MEKRSWAIVLLRSAILAAALTSLSAIYVYTVRANSTTAALTFLLVALASATLWGLPEAIFASIWSMLCLDFFFLPPVPALGIEDPQNWVAWCTFVITSLVTSELSTRMKKRAYEATQRQQEIERLYALSCSLMQGGTAVELAQRIPERIVENFGCRAVAFFDLVSGQLHRAGDRPEISEAMLVEAANSSELWRASGKSPALVPVRLGATAIGGMGFGEPSISRPAMQSIANLVALAMDRARKQDAAGQAEGARRHQELKSMLLDALAHEFQTPLTSIRAGIGAMLAESPGRDQREWLEIMDEESRRLSAMMAETIQMARLEAEHVDLDMQTHTVEDLIYSSLEKEMASGVQFEIDLPPNLPPVSVDAGLIRLVIRQVAGNALKYSHPGVPVSVRAHTDDTGVVVSVIDRGPGISSDEQDRIFENYYRGKQGRGHLTGMGMGLPIARKVVEAHNGRIWVESRPGEGATFSFTLPFSHEEANV